MSSWISTRYKTKNWSDYNQALKQRGSLSIWFDDEMVREAQSCGKRGRRQVAIQAYLTIKVLFGLPLRQTRVYGKPAEVSGADLGGPKRRPWRKIHIHCPRGVSMRKPWKYLPLRSRVAASVSLVTLLCMRLPGSGHPCYLTCSVRSRRTKRLAVSPAPLMHVNMHCRATEGAYDTRKCHDAIAARNANAVIPPRKNAKPWKPTSAGAIARNEAVNASRYLGRALWRQLSGYHRRSRVETKMNCVKLLGQSLMARDFDRQVAEVQVRIAVLNRYTALGIPVTEVVG